MERMPTVDEVRPSHCPGCGAASRPVGAPLVLHGHGSRERQFRGPLEAGGPPVQVLIRLRRYRCRGCGATVTVAPRSAVRKRLFTAAAIGLALALWAVLGMSAKQVRKRVSPWACVGNAAAVGWMALTRWTQAIQEGRLFPAVRAAPGGWSPRQVAERAATTLAALAPPAQAALEVLAFLGAARAG